MKISLLEARGYLLALQFHILGFSGGEWDVGLTGTFAATDLNSDLGDHSNGSPIPGLPGAPVSLDLGFHSGSVSDLAGSPQYDIEAATNIGKKVRVG